MKVEPIELPQSTCVYERYDPVTLEPQNTETYVRLQELGWTVDDFKGRTVLDIGCNSGLLSVYALRLGAAKVHACDAQPVFTDFLSRIVQERNLPITVEQSSFDKLEPAKHKADIVLFMEVLHWAVAQGLTLTDIACRLAALTEHVLYLEFPWSVEEPSIRAQTKLTKETYSADIVLDELTKYFTNVRVVRFMRYFGFASQSKRILIEAREKRPEVSILGQLPATYSLDIPLSRGRNESYLLTTARGFRVAKLLAPESPIPKRLPKPLCNRMFDELHHGNPKTIVAPEEWNDSYLFPASGGRHWMIFPFVGRLPLVATPKPAPIDFPHLIDLFINVRRDLRSVSADLLRQLQEHTLLTNVRILASPNSSWATDPGELGDIRDNLLQRLGEWMSDDPDALDALCHNDLQTGNFVLDENDRTRVVDLDNLSVGTIYSDGLTGLIFRGASKETLEQFCGRLGTEESRPVAYHDIALAIANGLIWFSIVRSQKSTTVIPEQISRLRVGLSETLRFADSM